MIGYRTSIANAFYRCGEVEAWGRGIGQIANGAIAEKLLPPKFDTSYGGLMLTFYRNPIVQMKESGIDDRGIAVVEYALQKGKVTNSDVQRLLNISKSTATRLFASLSDFLALNGTTGKGVFYSVKGITKGSRTIGR